MNLQYEYIKSPQQEKNILVMLHGYGSSKDDLAAVARLFENMPNTTFIVPNAPYKLNDYEGYYWFPLTFTENDIRLQSSEVIHQSNAILQDFINQISAKYNLPFAKIGLFGFSQGGIMALTNALYGNYNYAGVACHSGLFYEEAPSDTNRFNQQQKILLVHGENDSVVPIYHLKETAGFFKQNNIDFEMFTKKGLDHTIDHETLEITENFFLTCFK